MPRLAHSSEVTQLTSTAKHFSVGESVTRGALALMSTQPLTWGASLLTTALAPRLLGAEALGQFTVAVTLVSLVATATSLGVSEFLVRRVAQNPATLQRDLGVALLLQTITALLSAIVIGALIPVVAGSLVDPRLLYIALGGLLFAPAQSVLSSAFRGQELHTQYAWFNAANVIIGQVAGILVLLAGGDVLGYTATLTIALIGTTLLGWNLSGLRLSLPSVGGGALVRAFREFTWGGFPFLTWSITLSVTGEIDRVLLGLFVPAAEVGWYAAAYRIVAIPLFIPTLIITPLFPALSRSVHDPKTIRRMLTRTIRIVLLLMVPLSAGTIVIAPAIPSLLGWPADFEYAVPLMGLLSLQLPIVAIDMVFGVVLMAIGRQGRWVTVGVVAAALKVLSNFLAIPAFESFSGNGAIGASLVTLLSETVMLVGAVVLIPKHMLDPHLVWDMARIGLAGAVTVIVGAALLPHALALSVLGGAAAYVTVAVVLRALTRDDIQSLSAQLGRALPRRP
jgi:O-antigen/teichoic acid export membrane protein